MTTKHTPGPWEAVKSDHGWGVQTKPRKSYPSVIGIPTTEADARLVAAAPEMLAALKRIKGSSDFCNADWIDWATEQARAAIERAEKGTA